MFSCKEHQFDEYRQRTPRPKGRGVWRSFFDTVEEKIYAVNWSITGTSPARSTMRVEDLMGEGDSIRCRTVVIPCGARVWSREYSSSVYADIAGPRPE